MDKILVEIWFPSLMKAFDMYIPVNTRFYMIAAMAQNAVADITGGKYVPSDNALLCDRLTGDCFDMNKTPRESLLHNGSMLYII